MICDNYWNWIFLKFENIKLRRNTCEDGNWKLMFHFLGGKDRRIHWNISTTNFKGVKFKEVTKKNWNLEIRRLMTADTIIAQYLRAKFQNFRKSLYCKTCFTAKSIFKFQTETSPLLSYSWKNNTCVLENMVTNELIIINPQLHAKTIYSTILITMILE